jgi:regulatory protein
VVYRRSAKLGAARIKYELQAKGLAPDAVAKAVVDLKATESERAFAVWRKKFGSAAKTASERAKQVRFLASRGFGGEAIARAVSGAFDGDDGEDPLP